jgi:hypothetical protein
MGRHPDLLALPGGEGGGKGGAQITVKAIGMIEALPGVKVSMEMIQMLVT